MEITDRLFELRDVKYAQFQQKLTPGIDPDSFIGVRVPVLRKLAKEYIREEEAAEFIFSLPHRYYDENMLHGLLLSEYRDYDACIADVDAFLPFVDNWAVCDIMSPKVFRKHRDRLIEKIRAWTSSSHVYTCRFGMEMLMSHYLDGDFKPEYLKIPADVHSGEYYVNMMTAWFFATALAKQWDSSITYIENNVLDTWVHNKTIQKSRESFRITEEHKEYLNSLKR